jgi:hypothetical protein
VHLPCIYQLVDYVHILIEALARRCLGGEHRSLAGARSSVPIIRRKSPNSCKGRPPRRARIITRRGQGDAHGHAHGHAGGGMFVGIDVEIGNDERGVRTLVDRLRGAAPALIALEATGEYDLLCVAALTAAELPVVVVNPPSVGARAHASVRSTEARHITAACVTKARIRMSRGHWQAVINTMLGLLWGVLVA